MKFAHRKMIVTAEQFVPGKSTPKCAKGYGNHCDGFSAYVKLPGKKTTTRLKPDSWLVSDGFGNVSIYTPEQFAKEFIEVEA